MDTIFCDNPECDNEASEEIERADGTTLHLCCICDWAFAEGVQDTRQEPTP
jgi:hypothetical protein